MQDRMTAGAPRAGTPRAVMPRASKGRLAGLGGPSLWLIGWKYVWAALAAVVFACLQCSFFTRFDNSAFPFFGTVPDLLLMLCTGFAFFAGGLFSGSEKGAGSAGAAMGLFCGILSASFCAGGSIPLAIPFFCLAGYLAGSQNAALPERSFRAYMICQTFALPVRVVLTLICTMEFSGGIFSPMLLITSFLPEAVGTAAFAMLLYPFLKRMMRV